MRDSPPEPPVPDNRFPPAARLPDKQAFAAVFADGKPLRSRSHTLLVRPNGRGQARLGLVVGKKKLRRAVDRNRVRRVVRESFRRWRQRLPALDIVFIANPVIARTDNAALRAELEQQWRRLCRRYGTPRRAAPRAGALPTAN